MGAALGGVDDEGGDGGPEAKGMGARGGSLWRGWDGAVAEEGGMEQVLLGGGGGGGGLM